MQSSPLIPTTSNQPEMALPIQSPHFLHKSTSTHHPFHLIFSTKTKTRIITTRANKQSQSEQPTPSNPETQESPSLLTTQSDNKPSTSPGLGFGSSSSSSPPPRQSRDTKKRQRGRERASVIRRTPIEKPTFAAQQEQGQTQEQSKNENAFLLTWLGLGVLILVEGIALAASGFLPEQWDNFFVKYLYPSFTPTVFVFVTGTVVYGVVKYLRGEKGKS